MNINCPHCTAYLTVPEQYAGQLMKCPKCNSNFTVPALPAIDHEPAFSMAQSPPAPPVAPPTVAPSIPPAPAAPAFNLAPPEPAFDFAPSPSPASAPVSAPAPAPRQAPTQTPRPVTPSSPPGTMTRSFHIPLSSTILQWIPVGAVVLLFILQLSPWVGVYPGGVSVVTQGAWGAAFGDYSTPDPDMENVFKIKTEAEVKNPANEKKPEVLREVSNEPGKSWLLIFYLVPFFLVTLIVSIAVAVLPFVKIQLPPAVANLLPWKWGIIAVLNAVLLLFLALQLLLNLPLESSVKEWARNKAELDVRYDVKSKEPVPMTKPIEKFNSTERKTYESRWGQYSDWVSRTIWLKLALVLHILATVAAGLMYWMEKRGATEVQLEGGVRW